MLLLGAIVAAPARAAAPLDLGFVDSRFSAGSSERAVWLDRAVAVGGGTVRLTGNWAQIARTRPADPANPSDPAYRWETLDGAARDASARGLSILVTLGGAPAWAEGAGRDPEARPGTWRPDPAAYRAFATAAARRYSGSFTPAGGGALPHVRSWQAWNEPNLDHYLAPQWVRRDGRWRPASPGHYRRLLNAMAAGVQGVHASNRVVTAGTAPYGDDAGARRMRPVAFLRELLCLSPSLRARSCPERARFDVLSHHPYGVADPQRHALHPDDAAVPDVGRLVRVLRAAERKRVLPGRRTRPVWVTEISWDSSPPDPDGVPAARHARWLAEGLFELWRDGVSTVTWYLIRDQDPVPDYASTNQSGLFLASGEPKLAARAFAFPFVATRRDGRTELWGKAPRAGVVAIERLSGGRWQRVASVRAGGNRVFDRRVRTVPRRSLLRARQGQAVSLSYRSR